MKPEPFSQRLEQCRSITITTLVCHCDRYGKSTTASTFKTHRQTLNDWLKGSLHARNIEDILTLAEPVDQERFNTLIEELKEAVISALRTDHRILNHHQLSPATAVKFLSEHYTTTSATLTKIATLADSLNREEVHYDA